MMFLDIKEEESVWDFLQGYGKVTQLFADSFTVSFLNGSHITYTYDGIEKYTNKPRTLFWGKIEYEEPIRPKIRLTASTYPLNLTGGLGISVRNGLFRANKDLADKATDHVIEYLRLLAIRDQECPNSAGYEFISGKENYYIHKEEGIWLVDFRYRCYVPTVYFANREDAELIASYLEHGRFDLKG